MKLVEIYGLLKGDNMILKTYKKKINKTDEEKQLEKEYAIYQEIDYNRLTDKQLNDKYNKNYLLEND